MPEGPEITITEQYLKTKIRKKKVVSVEVLSGRYIHQTLKGLDMTKNTPLTIEDIGSKGKFLWIRFADYFTDDVQIFTYPNILNGHKYGRPESDPNYDPNKIEPFYDDGHGNAVLGSGSDISVLVSKLIDLPNILIGQ